MNLEKNTIKKLYGVIVFAVLFYLGVKRFDVVLDIFNYLLGLLAPFLLGAAIAYILSVPLRGIEKLLFSNKKAVNNKFIQKIKRPISVLLTFILVLGVVTVVIFLVVPEIVNTVKSVSAQVPVFFDRTIAWANKMFVQYPDILDQINKLNINWETVSSKIMSFIQNDLITTLSSTFQVAKGIVTSLVNIGIATFFSLYLLFQKETLSRQSTKIIRAYLKPERADRVLRVAKLSDNTFSNFLSGQCMEAVILGTMFVIAMSIFQFPYAVLVGVLIAFTALIPVFGAFIGCAIGCFLILLVNPIQAVWFLILFFILQAIEGNFIYPNVVGNAVGLPAMWVLVAVTLGGSMFGVAGMLFFIPLVSVFYALFRETVYEKLEKKKSEGLLTQEDVGVYEPSEAISEFEREENSKIGLESTSEAAEQTKSIDKSSKENKQEKAAATDTKKKKHSLFQTTKKK